MGPLQFFALRTEVPCHAGPAEGFAPGSAAPLGAAARGVAAVPRSSGRQKLELGQESGMGMDGKREIPDSELVAALEHMLFLGFFL